MIDEFRRLRAYQTSGKDTTTRRGGLLAYRL
jgi:hypothetical protein